MYYDEVLNGKVKTIKEKHIYKNGTDTFIYSFNELGLLTNVEKLNFLLGTKQKMINIYNSDNQKTNTNWYDENGKETYRNEFIYDKEGNLIKHIMTHPKSEGKVKRYFDYEVTFYIYDKNRNLIEKKELSKRKNSIKESFKEHNKYKYDSIGKCIIEENLNSKGHVIERKNNKYLNRKLVEILTWKMFEGEDLYLKDKYEYNEDGNMKSHIHFVYMYGSTEIEESKSIESYSYEYKYDIKGRLIEESKVTSLDDLTTKTSSWKYNNFDEKGNWRHQIIGKKIIEREIEYY
jgi:hypothetical protein